MRKYDQASNLNVMLEIKKTSSSDVLSSAFSAIRNNHEYAAVSIDDIGFMAALTVVPPKDCLRSTNTHKDQL